MPCVSFTSTAGSVAAINALKSTERKALTKDHFQELCFRHKCIRFRVRRRLQPAGLSEVRTLCSLSDHWCCLTRQWPAESELLLQCENACPPISRDGQTSYSRVTEFRTISQSGCIPSR
jgi:hypothetical protein